MYTHYTCVVHGIYSFFYLFFLEFTSSFSLHLFLSLQPFPFHDNSSTLSQFFTFGKSHKPYLSPSIRNYLLFFFSFFVLVVEDGMMKPTTLDSSVRFRWHIHFPFIFLQTKAYSPPTHRAADFPSGYSSGFSQSIKRLIRVR
ncbi:unnamed protein product [Cuscuta epithymum]|uniref:Uncharacterized protein n=1 Tax=Cuscuta epithymum TaxID=186058 RepID=A0AAV0CAC4_9ASTE|nr:unnamed protein product [Cuscuta epithymum]